MKMEQKYFISFILCPHCEKEISISYTKKAIKKIYKATAHKPDMVLDLANLIDEDGNILVCLKSEAR